MKRIVRFLPIFMLVPVYVSAQSIAGVDQFKSDAHKTLIVEIALPYQIREYAVPIAIQALQSKARSNFSTPENTVQTFFSSILAGNLAWNRELWTAEANRFNDELNRLKKHDNAYWGEQWKLTYAGKSIQMISRIDYAKYVIVEYRVMVSGVDRPVEQSTLALTRVGDKWLLTQELAKNPIMQAHKMNSNRIQVGESMLNTSVGPQDLVPNK